MRLLFVTGALACGRDGVADYVVRLAAAVRARGHSVAVAGLAEPEGQGACEVGEGVQRLPAWRGSLAQLGRFHNWQAAQRCDALSLHFVPYAWGRQGMSSLRLGKLGRGLQTVARRRQLMVHEVWQGESLGATLRQRAIGFLQKRAFRGLLGEYRPAVIHTSTELYAELIGRLGRKAGILPMFGAVDPPAPEAAAVLRATLPETPLPAEIGLHFGTLHPDWQPAAFLGWWAQDAARRARAPILVSIGGLGYGEAAWDALAASSRTGVVCLKLGRLPTEGLASWMQAADFGLTSVPWNLRGKSSTAAALREAGMEVVVIRRGTPVRHGRPQAVPRRGDRWLPFFEAPPDGDFPRRHPPATFLEAAADKLISDLNHEPS